MLRVPIRGRAALLANGCGLGILGRREPDLLATWTYTVPWNPGWRYDPLLDARVARVLPGGLSEYSLPLDGWQERMMYNYGASNTRSLVLGDGGTGFAGGPGTDGTFPAISRRTLRITEW